MLMPTGRYHFSNAALKAYIGNVDATCAVFWLAVLLSSFNWKLVIVAVIYTGFSIYIDKVKKMRYPAYFRHLRIKLVGNFKTAKKTKFNI